MCVKGEGSVCEGGEGGGGCCVYRGGEAVCVEGMGAGEESIVYILIL